MDQLNKKKWRQLSSSPSPIKVVALFITALSLTSCMFHGSTPEIGVPEKFTANNQSSPAIDLAQNPWWENLGSKELNSLVQEGLDRNKQLSMAVKNVELAQASLETIQLGWLPSINLLAGRASGNTTTFVSNLPIPVTSSTGFLAFIPSFLVNIFQLPNQIKGASKKVEASAADYLAVRTSISAQIVSAYAVLLASHEEERGLNDLKVDLQNRVSTSRAMTTKGLSSEVSFNDIDSEMQKLESQIAQNKANQVSAKNAVLILLGRSIGPLELQGKFSDLKVEQATPGNTPASVINSRPDVAAARAKIDAADYGISAAASMISPEINLTYVGTNINTTTNGSGGSANANMRSAVGLIALNPQVIGSVNTSNKQYDAALIQYVEVVDNALREVDNALVNFETNNQKLKLEERSLANTDKNTKTFDAMLQQGLISKTQYLEFKAKLYLANIAILQTKTQTIISYSKLYQSMGGGASFNEKKFNIEKQMVKTTQPNED
jgi:outer membrane protein TolC